MITEICEGASGEKRSWELLVANRSNLLLVVILRSSSTTLLT